MHSPDIAHLNRRSALTQMACGFGTLALAGLTAESRARDIGQSNVTSLAASPRAKRVIFLFMQGGVSQVDSFDYKPALQQRDGEMHGFDDARVIANTGKRGSSQRIMKSPWKFSQYGQSGRWVSELFPHIANRVDDLCMLHGMHTEGVAHGPATLFLHCGSTNSIRPSIGSWVTYGLGTENTDLPGFVSIAPSAGNGGVRNYGSAFLPARYQGIPLHKRSAAPPSGENRASAEVAASIRNLSSPLDPAAQRRQLDLIQSLNTLQRHRHEDDSRLEAVIHSYELAWRMQTVAPDVLDLSRETAATHAAYGLGDAATDSFARQCLTARRLCEAGVRFIQVTYGDNSANPAWDQHSNLPKHADHARAVDRPIAALLADLKARGLLEDTLVWWGGEFGRTPYAEKNGTGRDHNPNGFTVWLAGGGIRPGMQFGATDEFGHQAVRDRVHMHDLHATVLHLLGLDHRQLTYRHAGRDYRLTDVHGEIVDSIVG